jgi:hypothetical protein
MPQIISYSLFCRAGYGNCIGLPTMLRSSANVRVTGAELALISALSKDSAAVGRLAVGGSSGGWRITENQEIPMREPHVVPLNTRDEVASLVLQPGAQPLVTMSVQFRVDSGLTVGASHYPILPLGSFSVSFSRSNLPGVLICCDFGPLDGLRLSFRNVKGRIISNATGPWRTGRTFVSVPQSSALMFVTYMPRRRELAPPASLILEWLIARID